MLIIIHSLKLRFELYCSEHIFALVQGAIILKLNKESLFWKNMHCTTVATQNRYLTQETHFIWPATLIQGLEFTTREIYLLPLHFNKAQSFQKRKGP